VALLDAFNPKQVRDGKLSVLDVKATDQLGRTFQIEIQVKAEPGIPERMLFNWSGLYHSSLKH